MNQITPDYIKKHKIDFRPRTRAEVLFIQNALFDLGAGWRSGSLFGKKQRMVSCIDLCIEAGLQVDHGTMYVCSGGKNYIPCDSSQLRDGWTADPSFHLTTEIAEKYDLLFQPKDADEAAYLKAKLREGLVLSVKADDDEILRHGALVTGRRLLAGNAASDTGYPRLHCTMEHFRDYFGADILQALLPAAAEGDAPAVFSANDDQRFIRALFNELTEKIARLEKKIDKQSAKIDELTSEIRPKHISKKSLDS